MKRKRPKRKNNKGIHLDILKEFARICKVKKEQKEKLKQENLTKLDIGI